MLLLNEAELRGCVDMASAIDAMEGAFRALAEDRATLPPPVGLDIPEVRGEVHVKGAYLRGTPYFAFKVASGFYDNAKLGLPTGSGLMLVFDASTGFPAALLQDNAWLTDLRTAAAGGLAARLLARERIETVAMIGAGVQARLQARALAQVRDYSRLVVWNRTPERAEEYATEMSDVLDLPVDAAADVESAVAEADVVVTVTASREPLVRAAWLRPGATVIAVGSDGPDKQELDVDVLERADRLFADRLEQCRRLGEIHHGLDAGVIDADDVDGELGDLLLERVPGRAAGDEIIVADLTGVGVQDAAIASLALERARERDLGREVEG